MKFTNLLQKMKTPFFIGNILLATTACTDEPVFLNSQKILPSGLPLSEAVKVGDTLYLSGQIGIIPGSLDLISGGIEAEARQTMENIKATLMHHGYTMEDIVKCTTMLADISEWNKFNVIYRTFFTRHYPARSAFGASGLALNARVEVECIAVSR